MTTLLGPPIGDDAYYGRLFMNVKGSERQGIVILKDYGRIRSG